MLNSSLSFKGFGNWIVFYKPLVLFVVGCVLPSLGLTQYLPCVFYPFFLINNDTQLSSVFAREKKNRQLSCLFVSKIEFLWGN